MALLFKKTDGDAAKVDAKLVVDCARAGDAGLRPSLHALWMRLVLQWSLSSICLTRR